MDLNEVMAQVDEQILQKEEAIMKIKSLITPKIDTMDELSRLYELNFCANKNSLHRKEWRLRRELPRKISESSIKENRRKLYTVGAIEYGLPVPVTSRRNYYSTIIQRQIHVLNTNIVNTYRTALTNN